MLTSVSSSILAPSVCSRASKVSREVFPDLWSVKEQESTAVRILLGLFILPYIHTRFKDVKRAR